MKITITVSPEELAAYRLTSKMRDSERAMTQAAIRRRFHAAALRLADTPPLRIGDRVMFTRRSGTVIKGTIISRGPKNWKIAVHTPVPGSISGETRLSNWTVSPDHPTLKLQEGGAV